MKLDRVDHRDSLSIQREPRWQRLSQGRHIGFRRMTRGSPGNWLARFYDGEGYVYCPLGDFATLTDEERFDAAKAAAEAWFLHLDKGGAVESGTVREACTAYCAKLRQEKTEAAARDAEGSFRRLVDSDPIAKIELAKLKPAHLTAWRQRIFALGSKSYFNRNLTGLRAALNQAHLDGKVASDHAWLKALCPLDLDGKTGRRTLYLDRKERQAIIEKASDEFRPLLLSWTLLPLRPGDVAKCRVEHFDTKHGVLNVPSGKTESRDIPLSQSAIAHFKACAKGKLPGAWLVSRADGSQWKKEAWRDSMKEAAKAAKLPRATVAYTLRHSTITDLVSSPGSDVFTVAKLSGTSISMIERHYGHLRNEQAKAALERLALGVRT